MEKDTLLHIFRSSASVLSFKEILLASPELSEAQLRRRLHYYVQQGELYAVRRGLYAKDKNYDKRELATKIFTPSYISFETVLTEAGIIFQYYSAIFIATYQTKEIVCGNQPYSFRKLKDTILVDTTGVENRENYFIASRERAFLDVLYLSKNYYFDNLAPLNFDKVLSILPIYNNKRMEKVVYAQFKAFKKEERML
jgi:predicted transcriptional regulator of viral defense system